MVHDYSYWNTSRGLTTILRRRLVPVFVALIACTGCSLNIVFFPKNSRKFATSPSPALGCYWLYKKIQPEWLYTRIALRALKVSYSDLRRGRGCSELWKNTIFPEQPVSISSADLEVSCEKSGMTVSLEFSAPFNGLIFSKGHYSNPACR